MTLSRTDGSRFPAWLSALIFIVVTVGISLVIGFLTRPGEWYETLAKPAFNPPSWVFGPVWTILYVLIGIAGWRIWRLAPASLAMKLWFAQMILNWCWSPAFFGAESPLMALAIIVALLACILMFMVSAARHSRSAAWLFVPYLAWVAFATALNGSIVAMNS